jgi:hypothetical protein
MNRIWLALMLGALGIVSGCSSSLYQGNLAARDASGTERHFVLYWTRTSPLVGRATAGPATLLTECSPSTRVEFIDQYEGIVFLGTPGRDRILGQVGATEAHLVCGRVTNYGTWADAKAGPLSLMVYCEPAPTDQSREPRNYIAARPYPYIFQIVEKTKKWSLFGETLEAPPLPECRQR